MSSSHPTNDPKDIPILLDIVKDLGTVSSELIEAEKASNSSQRTYNMFATSMLDSYMGIVDTAFGNIQIWTAVGFFYTSTKKANEMVVS